MIRIVLAVAICGLTESCCSHSRLSSLNEAHESLVEALGDQRLTLSERREARSMLYEGRGKGLIPILINHLEDGRTFDPEAIADGAPADGSKTHVETVKMICEDLLYYIVLGTVERYQFKVSDWREWWERHQVLPIDEIWEISRKENGCPPKNPRK